MLFATMSGTAEDFALAIGVRARDAERRSFHRLAARLADGTEAAKFKTALPPSTDGPSSITVASRVGEVAGDAFFALIK